MFSLRKIATPSLAALFLVALPAWSALAQDAAKTPAKEPAVKEQPVQPAKEQAAPAKAQPAAEQPAKEGAAKAEPKTSPLDPMIRVNGTTITRLELDRAVKVMLAQNQVQQPLPAELMKQAQDAALEQLTSAELLFQEASKLEIKDLDKQIEDKIAQNRAKFASDLEFEKALKTVDMTPKDMREFTRKDIIISNFIEKRYAAKATVTDAEAQKFYDDNKEKFFTKPETARASHILIGSDEKATPEERQKAKAKAEEILRKVRGGGDFAALAKSDSTCPSSKDGGDLGTFTRGQMVPPFEKAVFALKPGEVSEVVETQFGYHVIKLTEIQQASTEKFDAVKGKIVEYLKREKTQKEIIDLVEKLRNTARIEKM
jgi:peptidyl-prolyl cis-trans isomerase C